VVNLPLFLRAFLLDFVETSLGLVFALTLVIPGDVDAAKAQSVIVISAIFAAAVSAGRRALPGLVAWLRERLSIA
jgi:hypothetical protein